MKKLVILSLLSVALLSSCGNGAKNEAMKAQNDSLMVELSSRNAELDEIMGAFNEVQEGFRQINEALNVNIYNLYKSLAAISSSLLAFRTSAHFSTLSGRMITLAASP